MSNGFGCQHAGHQSWIWKHISKIAFHINLTWLWYHCWLLPNCILFGPKPFMCPILPFVTLDHAHPWWLQCDLAGLHRGMIGLKTQKTRHDICTARMVTRCSNTMIKDKLQRKWFVGRCTVHQVFKVLLSLEQLPWRCGDCLGCFPILKFFSVTGGYF